LETARRDLCPQRSYLLKQRLTDCRGQEAYSRE